MTLDLFDTPDTRPAPTCQRCRQPVLRVRDNEIGVSVDLDPEPLSVTRPLTPGELIYEDHPKLGWYCLSANHRHGYPLHLMHICMHICTSSQQSQAKERARP